MTLSNGTDVCQLRLPLPCGHGVSSILSDIAEDRTLAFVAPENVVAVGESYRLSIDQRIPWSDPAVLAHDDRKSLPTVICFADSEERDRAVCHKATSDLSHYIRTEIKL
jgi:hypothetical protein